MLMNPRASTAAGLEVREADVLLTHSYHLPYDRKQLRKMQPYSPLGTLYAAALLRERGASVAVFDSMLNEPTAGFREALRMHRPKIVAIYEDDFNFLTKMCLTRMRELAWEMIAAARESGAKVVVHGSDASDHAAEYLRHGCEYVLDGEAEYTLLNVVQALRNGSGATAIPGVKWLKGVNGQASLSACEKGPAGHGGALPLPARDLIDFSVYREAWKRAHGFFSMNLIASRGCPFRCNWCAKPIFGDSYQLRQAREVAYEMRLLRDQCGAEHLWFADDIFALNRHWVQEFASAVEEFDCAVPFKIQARADLLTAETARALKRAGCREVWMGVESGAQKVLDAMDKGLRVEEVVDRATAPEARRHSGVLLPAVGVSRRGMGRNSEDDSVGARNASGRHWGVIFLPAAEHEILRAGSRTTRREAELVRQRRLVCDVQGRVQRSFLPRGSRCVACGSRKLAPPAVERGETQRDTRIVASGRGAGAGEPQSGCHRTAATERF